MMPRLVSLFTVIGMLLLTIGAQLQYDSVRTIRARTNPAIAYNELIEPNLPNIRVIQHTTFGLHNVIADVLWLKMIQYYGGGDPYGKYRQLPKLVDATITLDPRFSYPYTFSGLVLAGEGFSDEALAILDKGEEALPDLWEIPYHRATIYYINKKEPALAARNYSLASKKPGAPPIAEFLSAVQFEQSEDNHTALAIYQKLAETSTNTYIRDRAKAHVLHYAVLKELQKQVDQFERLEKRKPSSLQDLVQKNYILAVPESPLGRVFEYNQETGKVSSPFKK